MDEDKVGNLSLEKYTIEFVKAQNIFPIKETEQLITEVSKLCDLSLNIEVDDEHQKFITINLDDIKEAQEKYNAYLSEMYRAAGFGTPYGFINFDWVGLSTGEKAYLDLFSRINHAKSLIHYRLRESIKGSSNNEFPKSILLLLDEAELGFHLQWQKEYIYRLVKVIPLLFERERTKIQLIFATHSPMSLSDIPKSNVIFLEKKEGKCVVIGKERGPKHSFGANIHEMLYDAFYLKSGFIGDFSKYKIQEVIDWCTAQEQKERSEKIEKIIDIIDDPIIKVKINEMYAQKIGLNSEVERLRAQRDYINNKLKELGEQ